MVVLAALAAALSSAGCAAPGTSDGPLGGNADCSGGKCDHATPEIAVRDFQHRWAIDLAKVRQKTPGYTDRFVAATQEEIGLPDGLYQAACERERLVDEATGEVTGPGGCYLWGNTMRRDFDHRAHDESRVIPNLRADVDGDGQPELIDPPGYLNLIALKNTDRASQDEVHAYLRNGDILVYFHPEDSDTTQFRMHHAAMYYDTHEYDGAGPGPVALSLGEARYVHHIDNPVSYGPAFNAGVRSVPFHVYRFNPNGAPGVGGRDDEGFFRFACTEATDPELCAGGETFTISDEAARLYAYQARNWALVTNGNAPFSSFHQMTWLDAWKRDHDLSTGAPAPGRVPLLDDVDRFARPLVGGQTPSLYCAGLVFTNLNLALNRPMNEVGLGPALHAGFSEPGRQYEFDDAYMVHTFRPDDLRVDGLRTMGTLLFEPTTASGIVDAWVEGYFHQFDVSFGMLAAGARAGDPAAGARLAATMEQLRVPAALADALPPEQLGAIMGRAARAGIIDGAAADFARGFASLRGQANKDPGGAHGRHVLATPERVKLYAMAYASGDQDQLTIDVAAGELVATPGPDGLPDLPQMKEIELAHVDNRYVPPPMYHWLANRADSLISYVGTVIHVDLLTCLPGATCDDGSGVIDEFAEGGPDTSLYGHFFVPNGGRHVQRLLDVNAGPEVVGPGSEVRARLTTPNASDLRVVLHPAGTFPEVDRYLCDDRGRTRPDRGSLDTDCIPLDTPGVPLPLDASGGAAWSDQTVVWDLFAPVEDGGAGCTIEDDGRRTCPAFDWATRSASATERLELGSAHGQWTMTVLDVGADATGLALDNCAQCPTGGAHTNQWFIRVRNDAPAPAALPPLNPGQPWSASVARGELAIRTVEVPAGVSSLLVRLSSTSGDADLVVRDPSGAEAGISANGAGQEDVVEIEAPATGLFTIDVNGYTDARFDLEVTFTRVTAGPDPLLRIANDYTFDELVDRAGIAAQPARLIVRGRTEPLARDAGAGGGERPAGAWSGLDDLVSVSGIGDGTARKIEEHAAALAAQG